MRRADRRGAPRQRGIAAVELAVMMPVLIFMLVFPLYLGRVFWHYTVIQHAAQDAARYLSKIPASEMANPLRAPDLAKVAEAIADAQLTELAPGAFRYGLVVTCDGGLCLGFNRPAVVRVNIQVLMEDIFFSGYTSLTLSLTADVSYPYMGK